MQDLFELGMGNIELPADNRDDFDGRMIERVA
jgi:hypothetical protein